ncbi:MAG TPA: histidine ammonia-lyase [Rhodocyclaceae bacterium]|nr:histidine ammonia-lyase [Rhodocyclaceae bacterium]
MNTLAPGSLSLADLRTLAKSRTAIALDPACVAGVMASARAVHDIASTDTPFYGVNTGFGKLATTHIARDRLEALQINLVRSHAVGVGALLDDDTVRLALALKIASLARGYSGVRPEVLDTALAMYNAGIVPCVPSQGSVGASGDLAPLAHLALTLIGEGEVRVGGRVVPAAVALREAGIAPVALAAKEGLALLNGTQVSTAIALMGLLRAEQAFAAALIAGAMSVDAATGSDAPFDARIHAVRGHPGQIAVARHYRELLAGSAIRASHRYGDDRVQDPYSLRCQPQVMGACLELIRSAAATLAIEANAVSDNPLVFVDAAGGGADILSGGNFHAEPVAFAADTLALALAEVGALSERRIALLIDASLSGLPPFLVADAGLNSGFMIAHVTAAALASENKTLAHPASVDSLPTSANQEDHVSMATFAARKLADLALNVRHIIAIELLAAAQGIDFRRPLTSSAALETAHATIRAHVPFYDHDRVFAPDIAAIERLIDADAFTAHARDLLPSWHEGES